MNKKILLPLLAVILLIAFITIGILQYRSQKITVSETVPLLSPPETKQPVQPVAQITRMPGIAAATDIKTATKTVPDDVSLVEKNKVSEALPIRIENFATSGKINTVINIYSYSYDPASIIRLEIYGINFNISSLSGPNAIAFKESFQEAKKQLLLRGANVKNLQIIFGNRQYIQDTATYWVKEFKLLD